MRVRRGPSVFDYELKIYLKFEPDGHRYWLTLYKVAIRRETLFIAPQSNVQPMKIALPYYIPTYILLGSTKILKLRSGAHLDMLFLSVKVELFEKLKMGCLHLDNAMLSLRKYSAFFMPLFCEGRDCLWGFKDEGIRYRPSHFCSCTIIFLFGSIHKSRPSPFTRCSKWRCPSTAC